MENENLLRRIEHLEWIVNEMAYLWCCQGANFDKAYPKASKLYGAFDKPPENKD
jgi:hypothetical protein